MTGQVTPAPRNALPRPRVPEKVVQAQIVNLLRGIGAQVYILGTRRPRTDRHQGTCQTAGMADLEVFIRGELVKIEVKAADGRVSMAQMLYAACCHDAKVRYIRGGVDEVLAYLVERGIVREVAHSRHAAVTDEGTHGQEANHEENSEAHGEKGA